MGYRKLKINDKTYEYVIGKKFVNVRIDGVSNLYKHEEVGYQIGYFSGNPYGDETNSTFIPIQKFLVTPGSIRNRIENKHKKLITNKCNHEKCESNGYLMSNPFSIEIYNKKQYMPACKKCWIDLSYDI